MIATEKHDFGWVAHGCCSLGPVYEIGLTEQQAIAKARDRIRGYMIAHADEQLQRFRAAHPQVGQS